MQPRIRPRQHVPGDSAWQPGPDVRPHPADRHERWSCLLSIVLIAAAAVACWLVIGWLTAELVS